jgi:hypothetical protein
MLLYIEMSRDSAARLTFADRMKIIQGRHLFAYYVRKQQENINGTNTNPLNLYPLDNETSAYTTMKIGAVNTTLEEYNKYVAAASGIPTVQNTPPSAPTISSILVGNETITVYFDIPTSDGGAAIINYEYSTDDGATWTSSGSTTSPIIITGLTNGVEYTVKLRAVNSVGRGEASSPVSGTPATVPGIPSLYAYPIVGNSTLTIEFLSGPDGGSPITNYEYSLDLGTLIFPLNTTISPYTITGLINGDEYPIILRAINAIGYSEWSSPAYGKPGRVPDAPDNLIATPGNGSASISFDAGYDGGYMVLSYEYSINDGEVIDPFLNSSPIPINDLTNGVSYSIKIRGRNELGNGAWSSPVSVTPAIPVPSGNIYTSPTTNVDVTTVAQSPFSGGGYSYEFNGTSDYLTVSGDDSWAFGTGAFTIEWFQFQTDNNPFPRIFATATDSIGCSIESGTLYTWLNGQPNISASVTPYKSGWHHFALVRNSSGIVTIYKDGISLGSGSHTANIIDNISTLFIGVQEFPPEFNTWFGGYLTNIRIVKGLAVYTGDFDVPTSTLTLTAGANPYGGSNTVAIPAGFTKLLLVGIPPPTIAVDPGNITSYPGSGTTVTSIGTSSSIIGTLSNVTYNSSNGGYFTFAGTGTSHISFPQFNFGTAFTLVAWVRPSEQSNINTLFATASANSQTPGFKVGWNYWNGNTKPMWYEGGNGSSGSSSVTADGIITIGSWQQVAYVFNQASPKIDFYKNGVMLTSSGTPVVNIPMDKVWRIGNMFGAYSMKSDVGLFKIYPSILSTSDIQAEFNATKTAYGL